MPVPLPPSDELRPVAQAELEALTARRDAVMEELRVLLLPKDMQVFLSFRALVGYTDRQAYTANGGLRIGF